MDTSGQPLLAGPFKRRTFLMGALATFGLLTTGKWTVQAMPLERSLADLHLSDFQPLQGERFTLHTAAAPSTTVQLVTAKDRTQDQGRASHLGEECFCLTFSGTTDQNITQGSYTLSHAQLGRFELFLVPAQRIGQDERYIAIIHRISLAAARTAGFIPPLRDIV